MPLTSPSGGRSPGLTLEIRAVQEGGAAEKFIRTGKDAEALLSKLQGGAANYNRATNEATQGTNKWVTSLRQAATTIATFQGPLGPIAGRINSLATLLNRSTVAWVGLGAAVAASAFAVRGIILAGAELERVLLRNEALIRATGRTGEVTAVQIEKLARSFGRETLGSTEEGRSVLGQLLAQPNIALKQANELLRVAADIRTVFGKDLSTVANTLARGLEDPIRLMEQLRRLANTDLPDSLQNTVRELSNAGQEAEAFGLIIDFLNNKFGNAAEAEAGGFLGKLDTLVESFKELRDYLAESSTFGRALGNLFESVTSGFDIVRIKLGGGTLEEDLAIIDAERKKAAELLKNALGESGSLADRPKAFQDSVARLTDYVAKLNAEYERTLVLLELQTSATEAREKLEKDRLVREKSSEDQKRYQDALSAVRERSETDIERQVRSIMDQYNVPARFEGGIRRAYQSEILTREATRQEVSARQNLEQTTFARQQRELSTYAPNFNSLVELSRIRGNLQDNPFLQDPAAQEEAQRSLNRALVKTSENLSLAADTSIGAVDSLGQAILDSAKDFSSAGDIFKSAIASILDSLAQGLFQAGTSGIRSSIYAGLASYAGSGFQHGADFYVRGNAGGVDDHLLMARVSAGERVRITPRGGGGGGDVSTLRVVVDGSAQGVGQREIREIVAAVKAEVLDEATRRRSVIQTLRT